jgi:hypothetical protein
MVKGDVELANQVAGYVSGQIYEELVLSALISSKAPRAVFNKIVRALVAEAEGVGSPSLPSPSPADTVDNILLER